MRRWPGALPKVGCWWEVTCNEAMFGILNIEDGPKMNYRSVGLLSYKINVRPSLPSVTHIKQIAALAWAVKKVRLYIHQWTKFTTDGIQAKYYYSEISLVNRTNPVTLVVKWSILKESRFPQKKFNPGITTESPTSSFFFLPVISLE